MSRLRFLLCSLVVPSTFTVTQNQVRSNDVSIVHSHGRSLTRMSPCTHHLNPSVCTQRWVRMSVLILLATLFSSTESDHDADSSQRVSHRILSSSEIHTIAIDQRHQSCSQAACLRTALDKQDRHACHRRLDHAREFGTIPTRRK